MKRSGSPQSPAFKFKFSVTLEYLEIHKKADWKPRNLQLTWRRGQRQRDFHVSNDVLKCKSENSDDPEYVIATANWEQPTRSSLLVTLYKKVEDSPTFKRKEYLFSLEDARGPTKRKLAVFPLNIAEYASEQPISHPLEMEFRTLSNRTKSVTAGVHIDCQFVKKGTSTDDDMISNFSHVSDDDEEYRRLTLHVDEDVCGTVISCPLQQSKSSTAVLQSRALQTKSELLLDLNIAEQSNLVIMNGLESSAAAFKNPDEENMVFTPDDSPFIANADSGVTLGPPELDLCQMNEVKERRRLSALTDHRVNVKEEETLDQKTSKGNIFTTLKSGVKAVFQGRKGSISNGLQSPDTQHDGPMFQSKSTTSTSSMSSFDESESDRLKRKIFELETRIEELCAQCGNLEQENVSLKRDTEELQMEVGELQLLVEDFQSRLVYTEAERPRASAEADKLFEKMNLRGWLCKRGVKGGPLGKRWQRRWFEMDARGYLYYYKCNNNEVPRGFIALDLILAVEDVFPTVQDKNNASFNVITDGRTYELMAHDQEEKAKWINALDFIRSWRSQMVDNTF